MNAMAEPQAFALPKKPRVKQQEAPPDQRKVCVLPIRACTDRNLTEGMIRVLMVLCSYCNRAGITWVGQTKLAEQLGISRQAVTKQMTKLQQAGYIEVVRKGFRAERANTVRVIFDPTVDAETAIAVTSAQEPTRPPAMQDDQPDPAGQRRIAQLLAKALKSPVTKKEYTMPKEGDTRAVREVKEAMQKAKAKRSHKQPSEVANEDLSIGNQKALHRQPHRQPPEVAQTQEEQVLGKYLDKDSLKVKYSLGNLTESQRSEIERAGLTDREATEALATLLAAYQAEGLTPNPDRLATEVIQLAAVSRGIA